MCLAAERRGRKPTTRKEIRTLVEYVLDEELDRTPADPMVGLKLADEPEVLPAFDAREHAGRERANGILTDAQLEFSVGAPFANPLRFHDVRVD